MRMHMIPNMVGDLCFEESEGVDIDKLYWQTRRHFSYG